MHKYSKTTYEKFKEICTDLDLNDVIKMAKAGLHSNLAIIMKQYAEQYQELADNYANIEVPSVVKMVEMCKRNAQMSQEIFEEAKKAAEREQKGVVKSKNGKQNEKKHNEDKADESQLNVEQEALIDESDSDLKRVLKKRKVDDGKNM